jgi:hypothetical protein
MSDGFDKMMADFEATPIGALGKYVREHAVMVEPGTEGGVNVHFFTVGAVNDPKREDLVALIDACLVTDEFLASGQKGPGEFADFSPALFAKGHSYIALGGWIGSQEVALLLLGLGDHLDLWQVITPGLRGVTGPEADSMAGMGFVMASGYTPEGMDPASRYSPKPDPECCGNTPHDADCPLVLATAEAIAKRMVENEAKSEGVG